MQIINKAVKFSGKSTVVENDQTVSTTFLWSDHPQLKTADQRAVFSITFDFAEINRTRLLELATETLIIKWRASNRAVSNIEDVPEGIVKVADLLASQRRKVAPIVKASRQIDNLSKADKLAILATLQAELEEV